MSSNEPVGWFGRPWPVVRTGVLLLALVIAVSVGWAHQHRESTPSKFCTADGMIGNDGEVYGRSADQDCALVGEHGDPIPVGRDGRPIPA